GQARPDDVASTHRNKTHILSFNPHADKTHVSLFNPNPMFALVLLACVVAARKTVVGEREPLH
ncbi:hypothetical protein, partial [Bifidobacterium longum]